MHPVIPEVHLIVLAGVQNDYDILIIQLQDLEGLELRSKDCRIQQCELAEGPWNEIVTEAKDEASMFEGVDGLESESEVLGCEESEFSRHSFHSFLLNNFLIHLVLRQDCIGKVSQVSFSLSGGAKVHGK